MSVPGPGGHVDAAAHAGSALPSGNPPPPSTASAYSPTAAGVGVSLSKSCSRSAKYTLNCENKPLPHSSRDREWA